MTAATDAMGEAHCGSGSALGRSASLSDIDARRPAPATATHPKAEALSPGTAAPNKMAAGSPGMPTIISTAIPAPILAEIFPCKGGTASPPPRRRARPTAASHDDGASPFSTPHLQARAERTEAVAGKPKVPTHPSPSFRTWTADQILV